jgi:hypothetical protein
MKKHTPNEWKMTLDFIKDRSSTRSGMSSKARSSSSGNRTKTGLHLGEQHELVRGAFTDHMNEVATWQRKLVDTQKKAARSLKLLEGNISKLEGWIAARTEWPLKVNTMCQRFRDERIGIDLVMDEVEIELGKELDMLRNVATENPNAKLQQGYDAKVCMQRFSHRGESSNRCHGGGGVGLWWREGLGKCRGWRCGFFLGVRGHAGSGAVTRMIALIILLRVRLGV